MGLACQAFISSLLNVNEWKVKILTEALDCTDYFLIKAQTFCISKSRVETTKKKRYLKIGGLNTVIHSMDMRLLYSWICCDRRVFALLLLMVKKVEKYNWLYTKIFNKRLQTALLRKSSYFLLLNIRLGFYVLENYATLLSDTGSIYFSKLDDKSTATEIAL